MAEVIPLSIRTKMSAEQVDDFTIYLVTILDPEGGDPIRISSDPTMLLEEGDNYDLHGTISRGLKFNWVLMTAQRPDRTKDSLPQFVIQFEDLEGIVSELMLGTNDRTFCDIEEIRRSDLDTVIDSYPGLATTGARGDITQSSITLGYEHVVDQELVSGRMTEQVYPALFE